MAEEIARSGPNVSHVATLARPAFGLALSWPPGDLALRLALGVLVPGGLARLLLSLARLAALVYAVRLWFRVGSRNTDPLGLDDSFLAGGAAGATGLALTWLAGRIGTRTTPASLLGLLLAGMLGFVAGGAVSAAGWVFSTEETTGAEPAPPAGAAEPR